MNDRTKIRQGFVERGETITSWATAHNFPKEEVYAVLSGRLLGVRGRAHKIAIELGIKPDPKISNEEEK